MKINHKWQERIGCAVFCIVIHIVYEVFVHIVLPLLVAV